MAKKKNFNEQNQRDIILSMSVGCPTVVLLVVSMSALQQSQSLSLALNKVNGSDFSQMVAADTDLTKALYHSKQASRDKVNARLRSVRCRTQT